MNPLLTWVAEHLGAVLVGGLLIAIGTLLWGARATWRTARRLGARPRPALRFVLSLVLLAAGGFGVLLFGSGLSEMGPGIRAQRRMLGEPAPALAFSWVEDDSAGGLADFQGKVVLINVWATWCPPCRDEMADLDRLQRAYSAAGLVVLHLSDEDRETLLAWVEERPSSALHAYARPIPWPETGRPTSYVIDREGAVRRVLLGQRSYEQFENEVRRYL